MKKMISILTVLVLSIVTMLPVKVMAAEYPHKNSEVKHVNLLSDKTEYGIQPQTDGYYYWKVDSKTNQGTTYGSWRLGPQGAGPGTVSVNKTDTVTKPYNTSSSSVLAVRNKIGALNMSRIFLQNVKPSISGIITSKINKLYCRSLLTSTFFAEVKVSTANPSFSSPRLTSSSIASSSSITRILIKISSPFKIFIC